MPRRIRPDDQLTTVAHLGELRTRLVISVAAVGVAFGVAYGFHGVLLDALNRPLHGRTPTTLGIAEPFTTSFKVSLYAALVLAFPVVLWQVWSFVAPALGERRQETIARLVAVATGLLAAGVAFAYWVVLPSAIPFLLSFDSSHYQIQIRAASYYSFVSLTVLAVGLLFELPVVLLGLVRLRVLSAATLRSNRRIGIVVCVAIAVVLPGVDPVTTVLQALPILALFEGSIWAAVLLERRWARERAAAGDPAAARS